VAKAVETRVAVEATISEFLAARRMSGLRSTTSYQSSENPVQIVALRLALNERIKRMTMGR
jgi:hypothetical protein